MIKRAEKVPAGSIQRINKISSWILSKWTEIGWGMNPSMYLNENKPEPTLERGDVFWRGGLWNLNLTVDNVKPVDVDEKVYDFRTNQEKWHYHPEKARNWSVLKPIDYLSLKRFDP